MDSTPIASLVQLRSPFNGEIWTFSLVEGTPPSVETLLAAGFTRVEDPAPVVPKRKRGVDDTLSHG